ncbi:MAG TPA: NAD(P)-dependent alcohol dehydrogenase [Nitrospiria bacterium]|nr:NAD(P)-dependent alcohol dehydrogenase [Nitrospiria bacterium]
MKAIIYRRYGSPDVLEVADLPEPKPTGRKLLLVKVHAAGVNPVDCKMRSGKPRIPGFWLPRIPGSDVAGEVVRISGGVTRFRPGDAVYAMLSPFSGGACAEYALVPEKQAARKPINLSFPEAAAVPVSGLTAFQMLRELGEKQKGKRVLINGASGGVGTFAVQIAKARGAEVTGVTSVRNVELVKGIGADRVIDYTREDFTQSDVRYDIILDAVSNRSFHECESILTPKGIYIATLPSFSLVFHSLTGFFSGGRRAKIFSVRARGADLESLRELIEAGTLRPRIDRFFPLERATEAHAYSETGHASGKIVIQIVS